MEIIIFKQNKCIPCETLSNVLEYDLGLKADRIINLSTPQGDDIDLASKYGVMSTPVIVLVDDEGNAVSDVRGVPMRESIVEIFEKRDLI